MTETRDAIGVGSLSPVRIRTRQIADSDIGSVAQLLMQGFARSTIKDWLQIFGRLAEHPTPAGLPRFGYLMESDGVPVGAILIISSIVQTGNVSTIRCNLSGWYVSPVYKSYAHLLIARMLKSKDLTFVNVSAAPHTLPTIEAQGFSRYSNGQFFALGAPFTFADDVPVKVVAAGGIVKSHFEAFEHELLQTHARCGCISLWCTTPDRAYPFVFRSRMVRGFVPCAQLIYCRSMEEFVRFYKPIGRFFARRGRPVIMMDANGRISGLVGIYIDGILPRYYKGPVRPRLGDLAYTELALFGI